MKAIWWPRAVMTTAMRLDRVVRGVDCRRALPCAITSFLLAGLLETFLGGRFLYLFFGDSFGELGVDDSEHFVETGGC